jgi:CcmD family protein
MEPGLVFLFAAFFVAWLVLLLYLWNISGRLSSLRRELEALERRENDETQKSD